MYVCIGRRDGYSRIISSVFYYWSRYRGRGYRCFVWDYRLERRYPKRFEISKKKPLAKETFYLTFSGKMNLSNTFVLKPVTKLIVVKCSLSFFFLPYVFYDDEDLN